MGRLHGLDALRGVAALIVVLYHVDLMGPWRNGALAVDFFFLLSGYVMARTYEPRMASMGVIDFMRRRHRRLIRPFLVGCVFGAVLLLANTSPAAVAGSFGLALLFLPSPFLGRDVFGINTPGWSLFFELFANVIHAVLLYRLSNRALMFILVSFAAVYANHVWFHGIYAGLFFERFPITLVRTLVPYISGILLFRTLKDTPMPLPGWLAILALPAVIYFADWNGAKIFVILIGFPLIVSIGLNPVSKALVPVASAIGAMSYPLYAMHLPLMELTTPSTGAILGILLAALWVLFERMQASDGPAKDVIRSGPSKLTAPGNSAES